MQGILLYWGIYEIRILNWENMFLARSFHSLDSVLTFTLEWAGYWMAVIVCYITELIKESRGKCSRFTSQGSPPSNRLNGPWKDPSRQTLESLVFISLSFIVMSLEMTEKEEKSRVKRVDLLSLLWSWWRQNESRITLDFFAQLLCRNVWREDQRHILTKRHTNCGERTVLVIESAVDE